MFIATKISEERPVGLENSWNRPLTRQLGTAGVRSRSEVLRAPFLATIIKLNKFYILCRVADMPDSMVKPLISHVGHVPAPARFRHDSFYIVDVEAGI
jgi:hypothetical protein